MSTRYIYKLAFWTARNVRLAARSGFHWLVASCQQVAASLLISSSHSKPVKIRPVTTWYLQTCIKLLKQLASCIKLVDKKSENQFGARLVADLLSRGASNANASWCWLDNSKATGLQQICWKLLHSWLCGSFLVFDPRYNWPFDSFIQVYLFHLSNLSFLYCKNNQMFLRLFIVRHES